MSVQPLASNQRQEIDDLPLRRDTKEGRGRHGAQIDWPVIKLSIPAT